MWGSPCNSYKADMKAYTHGKHTQTCENSRPYFRTFRTDSHVMCFIYMLFPFLPMSTAEVHLYLQLEICWRQSWTIHWQLFDNTNASFKNHWHLIDYFEIVCKSLDNCRKSLTINKCSNMCNICQLWVVLPRGVHWYVKYSHWFPIDPTYIILKQPFFIWNL